jgi:hypothetical protein
MLREMLAGLRGNVRHPGADDKTRRLTQSCEGVAAPTPRRADHASAMRDFQIPSEGNQSFSGRKSKRLRKEIQEKPEGNPSICLLQIVTFQGLAALSGRI